MLPSTLKRFNIHVAEGSFIGIAEEITLPVIEKSQTDYRGAGMPGPVKIDQGYNELMMSLKLREYTPLMIRQLQQVDIEGTGLRFAGAYRSDEAGSKTVAVEVIARGRVSKLDFGNTKEGELTEFNTDFPLTYFKYVHNGETLVELDFVNGIEMIGGVDLLADTRRILNL
ncbi:MAG: phage major tail tube protein [Rhodobiaceae bacterium]|nr:phage major tail tube protein [Rhodobiaceae bacterium]